MKNIYLENQDLRINELRLNRKIDELELEKEELIKQLKLCEVSRSLPTDIDYLSEVRVKLFDEHVERLSKQTKEWNLMEGIRLGLNAEKQ